MITYKVYSKALESVKLGDEFFAGWPKRPSKSGLTNYQR